MALYRAIRAVQSQVHRKIILPRCRNFGWEALSDITPAVKGQPEQNSSPEPAAQSFRESGQLLPSSWRQAGHPFLYVQDDLPERFRIGALKQAVKQSSALGFQSLGPVLSAEDEHWHSSWHSIDLWFANQYRISPLRTYNPEEADLVLVPAALPLDRNIQNDFIANATIYCPHLYSKPHLVILSHGASPYMEMRSEIFTHQNAQRFIYVALNPYLNASLIFNNMLSAPQFFHVHWSRGTLPAHDHSALEGKVLISNRTDFAVESFQVRKPEREVIYKACIERSDYCRHLDFDKEGAIAVWQSMQRAYYVLHPRGDFMNRAAFYDTLLAEAIPVVFYDDYVKTLPFTDILDYSNLMEVIPMDLLSGPEGENAIDILQQRFTPEGAMRKLEYIASIKQIYQYLLDPVHELISFDQLDVIAREDDAYTMTLKSVLRNVCARGMIPGERCKPSAAGNGRRVGIHALIGTSSSEGQ